MISRAFSQAGRFLLAMKPYRSLFFERFDDDLNYFVALQTLAPFLVIFSSYGGCSILIAVFSFVGFVLAIVLLVLLLLILVLRLHYRVSVLAVFWIFGLIGGFAW